MVKGKNLLLYGVLAGGGILLASQLRTPLALKKLKFIKPRVKIGKIGLTNIELVITIDIENPTGKDLALDYFTGDLLYNSKRLSSFTFNSNKPVILKNSQITTVPFTVVISNLAAVSTLAKLVKTLSNGDKAPTIIDVTGTIYAGGFSYDVAFNYDLKNKPVAGIGQLSPYDIYWAIAKPTKGKTTKADLKKASKKGFNSFVRGGIVYMVRHSPNLEKLKQLCTEIEGLQKEYEVVIITDKQFGMMQNENPLSVATSMQKRNSFII